MAILINACNALNMFVMALMVLLGLKAVNTDAYTHSLLLNIS